MKKIFVDTSGWFALANSEDINHAAAANWLQRNSLPLFTTNHIFSETLTLMRYRLGHDEAVSFGNKLLESNSLIFHRATDEEEKAAWEIFRKYSDKGFSFIDCISFAIMRGLKMKEAFSFDKHFNQAGFRTLPD